MINSSLPRGLSRYTEDHVAEAVGRDRPNGRNSSRLLTGMVGLGRVGRAGD